MDGCVGRFCVQSSSDGRSAFLASALSLVSAMCWLRFLAAAPNSDHPVGKLAGRVVVRISIASGGGCRPWTDLHCGGFPTISAWRMICWAWRVVFSGLWCSHTNITVGWLVCAGLGEGCRRCLLAELGGSAPKGHVLALPHRSRSQAVSQLAGLQHDAGGSRFLFAAMAAFGVVGLFPNWLAIQGSASVEQHIPWCAVGTGCCELEMLYMLRWRIAIQSPPASL